MEPLSYGAADVARLLGCSRAHVHNLIAAGELPVLPHMGERKLVPRVAILALVAEAMGKRPPEVPIPSDEQLFMMNLERIECTCGGSCCLAEQGAFRLRN
jgi:hypothetical protein